MHRRKKRFEENEISYSLEATGYLMFNVSHWLFAHKYFSMSRQQPYKLWNREVPRRIVLCDKITNWIFLSLNAIPPIVFGLSEIGFEKSTKNKNWTL